MSLSNSPLPTTLAPMPSPLALARSRAIRVLADCALPRSILFAHGARSGARKRIALTFDDGPDALTPMYLDVLARSGMRATFFLVGEHAARDPGLAREIADRGHEIGGHGWTHDPFSTLSRGQLVADLARTSSVIPPSPGRPLVRPPHGQLTPRTLFSLAASGYSTVLWSVDSDDCRTQDPREIAWRVAPSRLARGDVVLLHETQPWTLQALPAILDGLASHGWELVTIRELMEETR
jgi:peptidoglycan/xylan/chitin deacetylase (PgdA/CDA1 family)